jgi:hypothetical protein
LQERRMRVLVYKQTHLGDPDLGGSWRHCMGPIRLRAYDAVVGIGGSSGEPQEWGIADKITWVGVGPQVYYGVVRFERYCSFGNQGPLVDDRLPMLTRKMKKARNRMILDDDEIDKFVEEAMKDAPASRDYDGLHPCCKPIC